MIRDGSKKHTIRRYRKHPTKVGDRLMLYTGQRTKQCELIAEVKCTAVVPVVIYAELGRVVVNGRMLSLDDTLRFAVRDGFANEMEFFEFFKRYPVDVRLNELEVIYWR
jgi:hypothetical protein